jgi:SAM-dependent methyltransferase
MPQKIRRSKSTSAFDKYHYYTNSVQSAEHDGELLWTIFKKTWTGKLPARPVLREDFCGTGCLCFEWVKLGKNHEAIGIDLDPKALSWGERKHRPEITAQQSDRVQLIKGDVLHRRATKPHMICALNFSYFFIKDRARLKKYFQSCKDSLVKGGVLALDVFGGPDYLLPSTDRRRNSEFKFDFWWEIKKFDAITHDIEAAIHFQPFGKTIRKNVFEYHWRLWNIPELAEILKECGFRHIEFWSEGLDRNGHGNGKFQKISSENNCATWVAYIIAK